MHDINVENYTDENDGIYNENKEIVLSDNKINPHTHGGDHPTPFTKGCMENDITASKKREENKSEESKVDIRKKEQQHQNSLAGHSHY